jgi:hypothetical protein
MRIGSALRTSRPSRRRDCGRPEHVTSYAIRHLRDSRMQSTMKWHRWPPLVRCGGRAGADGGEQDGVHRWASM